MSLLKDIGLAVLVLVIALGLTVGLLALTGCKHPLAPIPDPPPGAPAPLCSDSIGPDSAIDVFTGSCGNLQTTEADKTHYPCALCAPGEARGCVDSTHFTYCVGSYGCGDPRCAPPVKK